jgi:putative hemolysin
MKFFALFLLFILMISSVWGSSETKTLKTVEGELTLIQKNDLWLSPHCQKGDCQALKTPLKTSSQVQTRTYITQPAANFCESKGGHYLTGKYSSGNEDGICRFKDQSYILAWDYYYKFKDQKQ